MPGAESVSLVEDSVAVIFGGGISEEKALKSCNSSLSLCPCFLGSSLLLSNARNLLRSAKQFTPVGVPCGKCNDALKLSDLCPITTNQCLVIDDLVDSSAVSYALGL